MKNSVARLNTFFIFFFYTVNFVSFLKPTFSYMAIFLKVSFFILSVVREGVCWMVMNKINPCRNLEEMKWCLHIYLSYSKKYLNWILAIRNIWKQCCLFYRESLSKFSLYRMANIYLVSRIISTLGSVFYLEAMFQLVTDTKDYLEEIHIHGKMLHLECHLFPEILVRKQIYM